MQSWLAFQFKPDWTTNYDRLIQKALEGGGKRVDAKYTEGQLGYDAARP